jgi:hypothetical protein
MWWGRAGLSMACNMQGALSRWSAAFAAGLLLLLFPAAPAHAALTYFGSNGLTNDVGATMLAKSQLGFDRLTGAGMNAIRLDLSWPMIQPTGPSTYDWSDPDITLAGIPANVKVIALFDNSPTWARDAAQSTCGCHAPPSASRLADWQAFVKAALARYGSKIVAVEAWNEPNLAPYWGPTVDPARWGRLVHATATAARSVRPGIPIISGGIVGGTENNAAHSIGPIPFFQAAFAAVPGLASDIDAYGLHPYSRDECGSFGANSWAVQRDFTTDACASAGWDMQRLRYVISKYDAGAKIAVTEFGFHTAGSYAIDEASQRDWLVHSYDWFNAQSDVSVLLFHTLFDTAWEPSLNEASFGLVDKYNQPKPAWTAFHAKLAGVH